MTLKWVPNIWLSDSDDTDCKECGLRYFAHCAKCQKITCTWCACEVANPGPPMHVAPVGHVCKECQKSSGGR